MNDHRLTLLAVHAHPDDEASSTGGTLARYAAEGIRTAVVYVTSGEEGEILDPDLDPQEARGRLGAIREAEARKAAIILGIEELRFLGYPDSGMDGTPANANPLNLHNADPQEVAAKVVRVIRELQPDVVVTYNEQGGYGHPDHIAAHRATVAAFEAAADPDQFTEDGLPAWQASKLYYSVFSRNAFISLGRALKERGLPTPFDEVEFDPAEVAAEDARITTAIDVHQYMERKREALLAHRSQIPETHFFMTLPVDLAVKVFQTERYIRVRSHVPVPDREDDLFAGLRQTAGVHR